MRAQSAATAAWVMAAMLLLAGCGGSGSSGSPPPQPPPPPPSAPAVTREEAFRFLSQSTMGATESESARLIALGDSTNAYSRWIDAELAKPASLLLPAVESAYPNPVPVGFNIGSLNAPRIERWFENSLTGTDQLRQRVA